MSKKAESQSLLLTRTSNAPNPTKSQEQKMFSCLLDTPVLAPVFFESPPPWKIPSQGVKGRSRDFRNVNN